MQVATQAENWVGSAARAPRMEKHAPPQYFCWGKKSSYPPPVAQSSWSGLVHMEDSRSASDVGDAPARPQVLRIWAGSMEVAARKEEKGSPMMESRHEHASRGRDAAFMGEVPSSPNWFRACLHSGMQREAAMEAVQ